MSKRRRKPIAHAAVIAASLQIALDQATASSAALSTSTAPSQAVKP